MKEGLIKSTKKTHKMQLVFKKWEELSKEEVQSIFSLRSEVFIVEQNCPYQDIDGNDEKADHLLLYENNNLCGYTRIFPKNTQQQRITVLRIKKTAQHRYHVTQTTLTINNTLNSQQHINL